LVSTNQHAPFSTASLGQIKLSLSSGGDTGKTWEKALEDDQRLRRSEFATRAGVRRNHRRQGSATIGRNFLGKKDTYKMDE